MTMLDIGFPSLQDLESLARSSLPSATGVEGVPILQKPLNLPKKGMGQPITALHFSNYLFWDVEKGKIDFDKSKAYVIERVLSHGMLSDWYTLKAYYGKETIREVVLNIRHLDKYALHFCAAYFNEPIERFRCFHYAQSNPIHWDY